MQKELPDLAVLVKLSQRGDKEAYGKIYRFYVERIYRFVYYLIGNQPVAEDITQVTFLRLWKNLPSLSTHKGTFQAYAYTTARNLVIDWQRKKKDVSLDAAAQLEEADTNTDSLIIQEEAKQLHHVLASLPSEDRQLVSLRYFEELSYSDIAKIIGKNEGSIRVKLHRILAMLKNKLKGKI